MKDFGECQVRAKRGHDACLWINPNAGWPGSDGIAVVGLREKRSLSEKFTPAGGMQDDEMVIDSAAEEAEPTALDLINRRGGVALLEQYLAGSKVANAAPGLKRRRQGVKGSHRSVVCGRPPWMQAGICHRLSACGQVLTCVRPRVAAKHMPRALMESADRVHYAYSRSRRHPLSWFSRPRLLDRLPIILR